MNVACGVRELNGVFPRGREGWLRATVASILLGHSEGAFGRARQRRERREIVPPWMLALLVCVKERRRVGSAGATHASFMVDPSAGFEQA